jgi:hypothetical protein
MTRVPVDVDEAAEAADAGDVDGDTPRARRRTASAANSVEVEVEREITKRQLIESVTSIVIVVLYMVFTLFRDREAGVVVLDDADRKKGPEDDWEEG